METNKRILLSTELLSCYYQQSIGDQSPPINIILEVDSTGTFTDDALLYQGILKYGLEHPRGFVFTDLGNWLIKIYPNTVITIQILNLTYQRAQD